MWGTRLDLPEYTKCCFCVPLRRGILAWAYVKLVAVVITAVLFTAQSILMPLSAETVLAVFMCITLYLDAIFTIFSIFVGHMKRSRGLQIYFYCSLSTLSAFVIISLMLIITSIVRHFEYIHHHWIYALQDTLMAFFAVFVQVYILLLVRSEVLKLNRPPNLQFVNNDVEGATGNEDSAPSRGELEDDKSKTEDFAYSYTY